MKLENITIKNYRSISEVSFSINELSLIRKYYNKDYQKDIFIV